MTYDSGDFELCLDMALEEIDHANFEARREEAMARGGRIWPRVGTAPITD